MFVVQLSLLSMVDVKIINMNVSKSLFSELNRSSPSSSSSLSLFSSALYLTATASGESMIANLKVMNVKLTKGDGVCKAGSGGGIKVELESSSKLRVGTSSAPANEATKFNRCKCSGYGGGIMPDLADNSINSLIVSVDFTGCTAKSGGNNVFVNGGDSENWGITTSTLNVQHDN
ncbi:uncharacterized protein MONOS_13064 [Monocercomonoides exilis]|uniref:uncharacterized protein n=1 Tax=Monocercomonoides exilis TaxID=2049356 RepID=UPI00355A8E7D|nr:hypothetical protein MONOS_13064 [Monocercomonoides exilis]|eukprot:MONOS_13064.1-p1 / transcript=MONOS_13064.1 / gene=MONOS_13064 / organism=Monocercomonoides_exilis_PA203 / gene_product=unspecified product / transcript_product=unspecified product / location=Mono_scaffold00773:28475-29069(-) / protein_length=175 / sequence_SO=supercontig / SO=protein_coding / is_pseudo=false